MNQVNFMYKYISLLLITFSLIFLLEFNSNRLNAENYFPSVKLATTPTPVNMNDSEKITLDKDVVCHPCPPGNQPVPGRAECDNNMVITVFAGKSDDNLNYKYTISGGRIIGEGAKVSWDMTGAQPGTYQIRVDIEDKSKEQKRTETKTIEVKDGNCFYDCVCPTIWVISSASIVNVGEIVIFTANVSGGSADTITYNQIISEGKIIEGQGTPVIRVATNSKMAGKVVKATVEIVGLCGQCENKTESANVKIISKRGKK